MGLSVYQQLTYRAYSTSRELQIQ